MMVPLFAFTGAFQLAGDRLVRASLGACGLESYSLVDGAGMSTTPPECGHPAPFDEGTLAFVELTGGGEGIVHVAGRADAPFTAPEPWGQLRTVTPGEVALEQSGGTSRLLDLATGALGATVTEPESSNGVWRGADGNYLWKLGRGVDVEIAHTRPDGTELRRVPIPGLPTLPDFNEYVGVGCAF